MIEELIDTPMTVVESAQLGKASRINDAAGRYIEFCKSSVPTSTDFSGQAGHRLRPWCYIQVAPSVFRELGAEVVVIGAQPDGLNINADVGSTHVGQLQKAVVEHGLISGSPLTEMAIG